MMVIAFVAFIVPQICAWLIEGIVGVRCAIGKIMRS